MNLHGVPRMTMDIDLVLALDDANVDAFLLCARELALKPQAPVALESLKPVRVACVDDMIALKQNTGRRQDADDIEHLMRLKGESQ